MAQFCAEQFEPLRSALDKWPRMKIGEVRSSAATKDLTALYYMTPCNLAQVARRVSLVPELVKLTELAVEIKTFVGVEVLPTLYKYTDMPPFIL